jgi:hypothetical protein
MKKYIIALLFVSLHLSLTAQDKKEILLKTEVSEAIVFIKGAQVVRKTSVNLPIGNSTVKFTNLSPYIDAKSVQVKVDGEVVVLSVNHQQNYNDSIKQNDEIEKLQTQIQDFDDNIKLEQTNKEVVNEELSFLLENKKIGGTDKGVEYNNLKAISDFYSERINALKIKVLEIDKKIKKLQEDKKSAERNLAIIGSKKPEPTGEVIFTVSSKTAMRVPVELSYYVNNAGWFPSYDVRAKNISEPIMLTYKANIMQNTKEDWKNIKLKVSSANPNVGSVAQRLKTYFLNYYTKPPRYDFNENSNEARGVVLDEYGDPLTGVSVSIKGTNIGTLTDLDGDFYLTIPVGGGELMFSYIGFETQTRPISNSFMNIILKEELVELEALAVYGSRDGFSSLNSEQVLQGKVAGLSVEASRLRLRGGSSTPLPVTQIENQTSVEFEIKTPYTILSENKSTTVEVENYLLPASYEYYSVPKIDKDAFLLAYVTDWEQYNLLEGEANIFFENTFIGKTILDVRLLSDTLNISLGRDKNVLVQREKVKDFNTKKFLSSKTEITRDWKITVRNNKQQAITIMVLDQIPVSTLSEIEVSTDKLSDGTLNAETGEVKWKFTLQSAQKKELDLIYKVRFPKGKNLNVE